MDTPKVGTFDIAGLKLAQHMIDIDKAATTGDYLTYDESDKTLWNVIRSSSRSKRGKDCPGGIVMFNKRDGMFHVNLDKCLYDNPDWRKKILQAFSIPDEQAVFEIRNISTCRNCVGDKA